MEENILFLFTLFMKLRQIFSIFWLVISKSSNLLSGTALAFFNLRPRMFYFFDFNFPAVLEKSKVSPRSLSSEWYSILRLEV